MKIPFGVVFLIPATFAECVEYYERECNASRNSAKDS